MSENILGLCIWFSWSTSGLPLPIKVSIQKYNNCKNPSTFSSYSLKNIPTRGITRVGLEIMKTVTLSCIEKRPKPFGALYFVVPMCGDAIWGTMEYYASNEILMPSLSTYRKVITTKSLALEPGKRVVAKIVDYSIGIENWDRFSYPPPSPKFAYDVNADKNYGIIKCKIHSQKYQWNVSNSVCEW